MKDDCWYNLKEENGSVVIVKTSKEEKEEKIKTTIVEAKSKKNWKSVLFILPFLIIIPFFVAFFLKYSNGTIGNSKYRTFMIYMVGSDLESIGKIASYDLNDINGQKIDLKNNNVLLMVGGSKKWHNFVKEDEIGIYELKRSGFKKIKSYELSSMGDSNTLYNFIDFTTSNYKSEKYDFIFWNHGLASLGVESDEIYDDDFINIQELDNVFKKTKFAKDKLELIIFNNCMSGNVHMASIMKNYANYMVASEEVLYVGSIINRLDFLNDVKKEDNGYEIGLSYINRSDDSINKANNSGINKLESTLAMIDLSKINNVEKSINEYFDSINLEEEYKSVSKLRRKAKTYGDGDYDFDTVDLYSLVDSFGDISEVSLKENLQNSIKEAVVYNSSTNNYSNGLSIYFPYYGDEEHISSHIYIFEKMWNNEYTNFIQNYVDISTRSKRANRAGNEDEVLLLTNGVKKEDNRIILELTEEEKEKYQSANIYYFQKQDNKYQLLLKTDEVELSNNKIITNDSVILKTSNNKIVSAYKENDLFKIYGLLNDYDVLVKLSNNQGSGVINKVLIDSKDKPIGGLIDYNSEIIEYYVLNYNNLNETLTEEWDLNIEKIKVDNKTNNISFVENNLSNYYVLIEMFDVNNDKFYSNLTEIK